MFSTFDLNQEPAIWGQGDFGFYLNGAYFVNFEATGSQMTGSYKWVFTVFTMEKYFIKKAMENM